LPRTSTAPSVDELTSEPFQPILDFQIPPLDSFANGLTIASEFFTGGQTSFAHGPVRR
jgi:hypothetical protein